MIHLLQAGEALYGSCYAPPHFMKPISKATLETQGSGKVLNFHVAHLDYELILDESSVAKFGGSATCDEVWTLKGTLKVDGEEVPFMGFKVCVFGDYGELWSWGLLNAEVNLRFVSQVHTTPCNAEARMPTEFLHVTTPREKDNQSVIVVSTAENECRITDLTGGKGSSLAILTSVSQQFKTVNTQPELSPISA